MDLSVDMDGTQDMVFQNGACPVKGEEGNVVAQRLFIMLRTWTQDWFLNLSHGVPYKSILGSKMPKESIDLIIQQKVLAEQGVAEIVVWYSSFEGTTRTYECNFQVRTTNGTVTSQITVPIQI